MPELHHFGPHDGPEVHLLPPPPPEPLLPSLSRDEALYGGEDYEDNAETPPITPPLPARRSPLTTLRATIAAAVGRHETNIITRDMFGQEVVKTLHSQDVTELENKAFAELQLSETKDKWNIKEENLTNWQKLGKGVERFFDRMWRGTATENLHRVKEYKHGLKLSATAGIEGAISAEFNAEIDRLARKRLDDERQGFWKKTFGKGKDLFQETFALERDLHKYKVDATAKLRAEFENNPLDTTNPLYHLINRDVAAREEVARRLSDTPLEILQESNQKNTKVESIKLEGPAGKKVETFLKEQIFSKVVDDALSRSVDRTQPFRVNDKLRVNLDKTLNDYFFSEDFQEWRKTLNPEQQAAFENSFTYASTILTQAEETLAPAVLDNADHYRSADRLNFDIELALGTTQYSANTEAKLENWGARKERASMNQQIWDQMRRQVKNQSESTYQFRADAVNQGLRRERILGAVDSIVRNEMVAAATGVLVGKSLVTSLRAGLGWVPFIGSAVAGGVSATKEWGRLNRMRAQYGFEEAIGLSHPQSLNAKKSEQMRNVDYHRIELGRRVQQLSDMTEKLNTGSYTDADLLQTLGYLADSKARIRLSDHYGINLLTASKDTPEGRAIYQREVRLHDLARAAATSKAKEIIDNNRDLMQRLGDTIGLENLQSGNGGIPYHDTNGLINTLALSLEHNLETGTQIPTELQVALGSLTISEAESIQARDQAFNKLRWTSSAVRGVTTGIIAGLATTGLGHFFGSHSETMASTHNVIDLKVVDHALPTHIDDLGGIGHVTNPLTDESITMHVHLPAGTHLVVDPIRVGGPDDMETAYNLVGANNEVLVRGMQFNHDGQLQMSIEVRDALAHNHIEYEATPLSPITWEAASETTTTTEIDPSQWTHSLTYEQMGGSPDAFFNNNINQLRLEHPEYADIDNSTFINGLRYTLRGMENHIYNHSNVHINQIEGYPRDVHFRDSVWGQEFVIAPQADNTEITNLPDFIATAEGNERVMSLIHESIQQYNSTQTFTDEAHRIAYEMSRIGTEDKVPDAEEIKVLVEYLGATSTPAPATEEVVNTIVPHDAWFTATESITTPVEIPIADTYTMSNIEWYNALIPTGFARPLEARNSKRPFNEIGHYSDEYGESIYPEEYDQNQTMYDFLENYPISEENLRTYSEYYDQYPEYSHSYPEATKFIPYYEYIYDALHLTDEEKIRLRTLPYDNRMIELYRLADYEIDQTKGYAENITYLYGLVLDENVNKVDTSPEKLAKLHKDRVVAQEKLLDTLKTKYTNSSTNPNVLSTLYRLNKNTKNYYEELESINSQLPSMSEKCKMVAIIPAYNEDGKIQNTIEGWLTQYSQNSKKLLDPDLFELIVLVNRPNETVPFDRTQQILESIKGDPKYQKYHIHVVSKTFNFTDKDTNTEINGQKLTVKKGPRMGLIYGLATNLAILRNTKRNVPPADKAELIIKPGGADVLGRSKYYIDRALNTFKDPSIEQWKSRADYPEEVNNKVPLFQFATTFKEMMNTQLTRGKTNLGLGMFRASLYAEAGGFNPADEIAEEVRLNERMRSALGKKSSGTKILRNRVLNALDDPRRTLNAIWNGVPIINEYGGFSSRPDIRKLEVIEMVNGKIPKVAEFNTVNATNQINPTFKYFVRQLYKYSSNPSVRGNANASIDQASKYARRALSFMGLGPAEFQIVYPTKTNKNQASLSNEDLISKVKLQVLSLDGAINKGKKYTPKNLD